ncbi:MAG TPA: hypothetical protein ENN08_01705 [Bacteroidales bacterium]|nr:hypothetical protein [Bacteroidales bacterium]
MFKFNGLVAKNQIYVVIFYEATHKTLPATILFKDFLQIVCSAPEKQGFSCWHDLKECGGQTLRLLLPDGCLFEVQFRKQKIMITFRAFSKAHQCLQYWQYRRVIAF